MAEHFTTRHVFKNHIQIRIILNGSIERDGHKKRGKKEKHISELQLRGAILHLARRIKKDQKKSTFSSADTHF